MTIFSSFRMSLIEWKTMIVALWLLQAVNYTAYILILVFQGAASAAGGGEAVTESDLLLMVVFFFLPCLLVWLTLASGPAVSHWPNIVVGGLFALIKLVATVGSATGAIGSVDGEFPAALFLNELWAFVAAALLVRYAWRLPGPDGADAP